MLDMIDDPLFFSITYCSYFKFGKETLGVLNDQLKTGTKYRLSASDLPKGKELPPPCHSNCGVSHRVHITRVGLFYFTQKTALT